MIIYKRGDVLQSDIPNHLVVHQVNLVGSFGAGIAKQIKTIYPNVFKAYSEKYNRGDFQLGDIQIIQFTNVINPSCLGIVNLAGQARVGQGLQTSYRALQIGIKTLLNWCKEEGVFNIGSPKIGSGLGGGDWNRIETILKNELKDHPNINWYVYIID